ncbi:MAG TPA: YjgP/YjgQ family permease [candidate division WOR-3 bacterium]|uniref:YjgP/YjgQ family permease n=1 Tax=candidate division WOR-3 bacterium TaxID=2052148 RepID=A0A7V0T5F0_UNCW3|nr:YjgP/YjgQ family permease [candidate division WOR-3 bacterium]
MTILQRHALRQFVAPFFLAIAILAFVLLMDRLFLLADLLVRKGVQVVVVGEIMVLSLPFVVSVCVPLGSLISGVMTYGRMAQDNEIRVVRAAGIPVFRLVWPTAALCLALAALMVGFNGFVLPEAQHRVRNLLTDVARKKPALRVREGVFMDDFGNYLIYIGGIDERRSLVRNIAIFERKAGGETRPGFVTAPRGEIGYTADDRYMVLTLLDGEMHEVSENDSYRRLQFTRHVINVRLDEDLIRRDREYRSNQELTFFQLLGRVREMRAEVRENAEQAAASRAAGERDEAERLRAEELEVRLRYKRLELARFQVEFEKRLSLAFSAFFFLLFGAPLGILLRRGGVGTGFLVGLVFFALYYVLLLAGQNLADSGRLSPFVGMWLPNLLLVGPVAELLSRAMFERSLVAYLVPRAWRGRRPGRFLRRGRSA